MKYGLGIKLIISFVVGGIAILYKYRVNPKNNSSEFSAIISVPRPFLFNLVSNVDNVPKFFKWVTDIYEVDPRKNISMGKQYMGKVAMIPFIPDFNFLYKISEVKHGQWLIMKPDGVKGSFLNAEIIVMFNSITHTETQFYMKIVYHRTSLLFQLTIGPLLKYLTDQELRKTHKHVDELAMTKWKEWQATTTTKARPTPTTDSTKANKKSPSTTTTKKPTKSPLSSSKKKSK